MLKSLNRIRDALFGSRGKSRAIQEVMGHNSLAMEPQTAQVLKCSCGCVWRNEPWCQLGIPWEGSFLDEEQDTTVRIWNECGSN